MREREERRRGRHIEIAALALEPVARHLELELVPRFVVPGGVSVHEQARRLRERHPRHRERREVLDREMRLDRVAAGAEIQNPLHAVGRIHRVGQQPVGGEQERAHIEARLLGRPHAVPVQAAVFLVVEVRDPFHNFLWRVLRSGARVRTVFHFPEQALAGLDRFVCFDPAPEAVPERAVVEAHNVLEDVLLLRVHEFVVGIEHLRSRAREATADHLLHRARRVRHILQAALHRSPLLIDPGRALERSCRSELPEPLRRRSGHLGETLVRDRVERMGQDKHPRHVEVVEEGQAEFERLHTELEALQLLANDRFPGLDERSEDGPGIFGHVHLLAAVPEHRVLPAQRPQSWCPRVRPYPDARVFETFHDLAAHQHVRRIDVLDLVDQPHVERLRHVPVRDPFDERADPPALSERGRGAQPLRQPRRRSRRRPLLGLPPHMGHVELDEAVLDVRVLPEPAPGLVERIDLPGEQLLFGREVQRPVDDRREAPEDGIVGGLRLAECLRQARGDRLRIPRHIEPDAEGFPQQPVFLGDRERFPLVVHVLGETREPADLGKDRLIPFAVENVRLEIPLAEGIEHRTSRRGIDPGLVPGGDPTPGIERLEAGEAAEHVQEPLMHALQRWRRAGEVGTHPWRQGEPWKTRQGRGTGLARRFNDIRERPQALAVGRGRRCRSTRGRGCDRRRGSRRTGRRGARRGFGELRGRFLGDLWYNGRDWRCVCGHEPIHHVRQCQAPRQHRVGDIGRRLAQTVRQALERGHVRLRQGRDRDPSRALRRRADGRGDRTVQGIGWSVDPRHRPLQERPDLPRQRGIALGFHQPRQDLVRDLVDVVAERLGDLEHARGFQQ